ncbi:hypothetical protein MNBD_NITROSPINAE02-654 [hydrothermal vent metagenome]|uniref:Methyltransferase type 11 domain-containing protein n=1 Tax=hydrothermal vent metagenome TaxID=652676 RepID=A0A3B1D9E3_9ZZZZ
MDDLNVTIAQAPGLMATLVDNFIALPADFSDIPVLPEAINSDTATLLEELVTAINKGEMERAFVEALKHKSESFDFDYLRGKILLSQKQYFEANIEFTNALMKFDGYGEIWFLRGICQYQMGLTGDAFMDWLETAHVNKNHNDALLLIKLGAKMIRNTHQHLNPELMVVAPIVSGKGIDVGCGSAKTHPDCIGVDIIAPGEKGDVASQKGLVSQADIMASGDRLDMFGEGELDYVIARHNLEHYDDPVKTLAEWRRVLKPGGVMGLVLPDDDAFDTMSADKTHKHPFTRSSLKKIVDEMADLTLVETGVSQHLWSFYAIIEKTPDGRAPSYNFRRKRSEWLCKEVAARARVAMETGVNDVAAAAFKKLAELLPGAPLPADPESLYPFPFEKQSYVKTAKEGARKVVTMGGSQMMEDSARILESMGHAVYHLPLDPKREIGYPMERRLGEIGPSLVFTFGFYPKLSQTLGQLAIPYASWVIGAAADTKLKGEDFAASTFIFHSRQKDEKYFKSPGAGNVRHLPVGVAIDRFRPGRQDEKQAADISFAGESHRENEYTKILTHLKTRLMSKEYDSQEKNEVFKWIRIFGLIFEKQTTDLTRWLLPELWSEFAGGGDPPGFIGKSRSDILTALGQEIEARQRSSVIGALAGMEINVWGDKGWENNIGTGAIYRGDFDNHSAAPLIYSNSKINIIKARLGDQNTFGTRFFEISACRGFILADYREAYESDGAFEIGKDFACYHTPEEAAELARHYLAHPEERKAIARNAYLKTVERHSLKQQWKTIQNTLRKSGIF